ncbi:hypothetical protein [Aliivibrio fischeri]|uniref:hypothetical protein n=1 Tax=Aliivibrio fischeri TaxID=668 RepID=UPI001F2D5838|nr:hypothetical protein [Aliivibrio fischeri]MCE7536810.1 hypothetical protein [Aliivibrio fischeri]MCE7560474.1 hypothetical protein [Aliivibrio fischeri]
MNFFFKLKQQIEVLFFEERVLDSIFRKIKLKNSKEELQQKILIATKSDTREGKDKIFKLLNYEFNFLKIKQLGLSPKHVKRLSELIYQSHNGKILKEEYKSLLDDFSCLQPVSLSICNWDKIVFICNINGLFKLSGICRQKSIDYVVERYKNDQTIISTIARFKVYLDSGDYEKANLILNKAILISKSRYVRCLHENFYNYGNIPPFKNYELDKNKKLFSDLIANKKVAIVAPGLVDINEEVINEINSFDLIILFNYKGRKIDDRIIAPFLSYYNGESSFLLSSTFESFVNDLKFVVFKSKDLAYKEELINTGRAKYIDRDLNQFFFSQSPNMLQIILDDILKYKASKVKIFGVNFYLSKNIYFKGYRDSGDRDVILRGFSYHNMISQINFVRNIYKVGAIELEQSTVDIINMDEADLLGAFESIYSNIER